MNIFRKLRKQFADDNQFLRYARYAVGEIVLIVIGIFIALQLNNWNEDRKNKELEFQYYTRIMDDFKMDKGIIESMLESIDNRIQTSKLLLLELDKQQKSKDYLLNTLLNAVRSNVFIPRKTTFMDLTSSGNLHILRDIDLKNSLIQYYSDLENKLLLIKKNRDIIIEANYKLGTPVELGIYEFEYMKQVLDRDIIDTMTDHDWPRNKSSETYINFQNFLLMNIAMNLRIKHHLEEINQKIDVPYQRLLAKTTK